MIHRRSFITGLVSLIAAPAIVRAGSLMPVKVMVERRDWRVPEGAYWRIEALPKATWRLLNEGTRFARNDLIDEALGLRDAG